MCLCYYEFISCTSADRVDLSMAYGSVVHVANQLALISDGWVTEICNIVYVSFSMCVGQFVCKISSINLAFVIYDLYSSPNIIWAIKSQRTRWAGKAARMGERSI
jgi:hypothetical protein